MNTYVHLVTNAELKRWLERQGATFEPAKGGHMWVMLRGRGKGSSKVYRQLASLAAVANVKELTAVHR